MRMKYIDDYNCISIFTKEEKENLEWLINIDDNVDTMIQYIIEHSDVTEHIQKLANQTGSGNIAFAIGAKEDKDVTMIAFHFVIIDEPEENNLKRCKMMQGERQIQCNGMEIDVNREEDLRSNICLDNFFDAMNRINNLKEGLVQYFDKNQKNVYDGNEEAQNIAYQAIINDSMAEVAYMFLSKMAEDDRITDTLFQSLGDYYAGHLNKLLTDTCDALHVKTEDIEVEGNNPFSITKEHFYPDKEEKQQCLYSFSSMEDLTACVTAFHIKTDVYKNGDIYQMILESPGELDRYMDFAVSKVKVPDVMMEHKDELQSFHSEFLLKLED